MDFHFVTAGNVRVGIECDDREFHDESRDEWRCAMILGDYHVYVIYKLRGRHITNFIEDILVVLQKIEISDVSGERSWSLTHLSATYC